jgi:hypothetical protein
MSVKKGLNMATRKAKRPEPMTAIQFAWYYLVKNGYEGVEHAYYGGYERHDPKMELSRRDRHISDYREVITMRDEALKDIIKYGVDWKLTGPPTSDYASYFNGTFAEEQGRKETLTGRLILKNGKQQYWVADAIEVTNVFELMANAEQAKADFKEVFGE